MLHRIPLAAQVENIKDFLHRQKWDAFVQVNLIDGHRRLIVQGDLHGCTGRNCQDKEEQN
jgi:hypothetical protein